MRLALEAYMVSYHSSNDNIQLLWMAEESAVWLMPLRVLPDETPL